jgi:hypothetical protein
MCYREEKMIKRLKKTLVILSVSFRKDDKKTEENTCDLICEFHGK